MNRLFLVAAAATSVLTFYSATSAQAETHAVAPIARVVSERFDLGETRQPLVHGSVEIVMQEDAEHFEHPLNDAWLGMPFKGEQGTMIGFVVDAPVDKDGEIVEVHVGTPDLYGEDNSGAETDDLLVFPAERVTLTDDAVVLLPAQSELVAELAR